MADYRKPRDNNPKQNAGSRRTLKQGKIAHKKASSTPSPLDDILPKGSKPEITSGTVTSVIKGLGLEFEKSAIAKMVDHLLLIKEINREVNLVSRVEVEANLIKSLWESLAVIGKKKWKTGTEVLDLGTGGGFPGVPVAIASPGIRVTLLDSRRAKTLALSRVLSELDLENVRVLHDRAETLKEHEETRYDIVTARAVGSLKEVAPWAAGLLKPGGKLYTWKGIEGLREMRDLPKESWKFHGKITVQNHRNILILEFRV